MWYDCILLFQFVSQKGEENQNPIALFHGLMMAMDWLTKVVQIQMGIQMVIGVQLKSMKVVNLSLNQENGDIAVTIVEGTKVIQVIFA